jgi:hypothetical protein
MPASLSWRAHPSWNLRTTWATWSTADISEAERGSLNDLAVIALQETTGWLEYLQSPEALRNARRARERRIASRNERRSRTSNQNCEPGTEHEHEPRTQNSEE